MKRILIIYSMLMLSCQSTVDKPAAQSDDEAFKPDTSTRSRESPCLAVDSLMEVITQKALMIDSMKTELFLSDLRIEKVKYYLNITLRDKSQDKFLKGWIKRAVQ